MRKQGLFILFVLLALVLASCGQPVAEGGGQPTAPSGEEAPSQEEVEQPTSPPAVSGEQPEVCASDEIGCAVIPPGQTIKIGMGGPMTGDNASFGVDISQGAQIAIQNANEEPLEGFSFELVAQDTGGSPEGGAAVANRLVSDPTVVAIAGHIFSGSAEAAIPIYERAGLPMLSPSATNPPLTELGSSVFNRIAFTDAVQGKAAASYLFNELGVRRLAVMHDGGAYGQGLADVVRQEFTDLGGEVVAYEGITVGEANYSPYLSAISAQNPDAVYFGGYVAEGVVLVNQMDESGLTDVIFFGCDGTYGAEFIDKTGPNGEGSFATSLVPPASEEKEQFDQTYRQMFGVEAGSLSPFTWSGHDVAAALIDRIRAVAVLGDDGNLYIPRKALVNAVRNLSGFQGITGDITCNEVGECNTSGPTFYVVQDGEWALAQ